MFAILLYGHDTLILNHTSQPSGREVGTDMLLMEGGKLYPPPRMLNQYLKHPAGGCQNYKLDRFSPLKSYRYFPLWFPRHTPKSILSFLLKCLSRILLTCFVSVGDVGHSNALNLSIKHN